MNILTSVNNMEYYTLDFNKIDTNKIKDYVEFLSAVGLLHFIQNNVGRSLVDFVTGVEVGLESNARKNRSGTIMESILESYIQKIAIKNNMEYSTQCTAKFIKDTWNIAVPTDKARRRFDAVLYSKEHNKIWIFETNYYGGGGSKLKSVSGEFNELQSLINTSDEDITFVWITDGKGWNTSKLPLQEAFGHIPYIFNLKMLSNGFLQDLITFDILKETRKVK